MAAGEWPLLGRLYDMHCHCSELGGGELGSILESTPGLVVVAVSEDLPSLMETLELAEAYPGRVVPCAGFHPWVIGESPLAQVEEVLRWASRLGLTCLGEVGLDRKFVPTTWRVQVQVFERVLREARELGAMVNIHAPDAWRQALSMLLDHDIEKAMFHWYTGPKTLIQAIGEAGYKISINPALQIQKKHRAIMEATPIEYMVTESDGPYNYKGLRLNPTMIPDTIKAIAQAKNLTPEEAAEKLASNARRLLTGATL